MLDKFPAWARHFAIVMGAVLLAAVSEQINNGGFDLDSLGKAVVAGLVAQGLLWITPLTRQYGVGAPPPPGEPVINPDLPPVT